MWKFLIRTIIEAMYGHLSSEELLKNKQKGCRKKLQSEKRPTSNRQAILKNWWRRLTNLSMERVFEYTDTEGMLFAAQEQALRTNSIKENM